MTKNRKILLKHIPLFFIFVNAIFVMYYLSVSTRNVVFMDYWRSSEKFIPLACNGELTFSDLWNADWGQRNPLLYGLYYLNIKYLHLNAMVPVYLGIGTICINIILYYYISFKITYRNISLSKQLILFLPIILCFFCLNQWEIMETQFSFPFYIRILVYALTIYLVDDALIKSRHISMLSASIIMPFATCFLSQLYFVGMIMSVGLLLLIIFLTDKGKRKLCMKYLLLWTILNGIGVIVYFHNLKVAETGGNLLYFLKNIVSGKVFFGFFYLLNSSVLQVKVANWTNTVLIISLGIVLSIIICFSLFLYCKNKMFSVSYMPILYIFYGVFSIGAITYGRMSAFTEFSSFASSRYVVDTTSIWIGCLCILGYSWIKTKWKSIILLIIFISSCHIMCNYDVYIQREYKGAYKENISVMCLNIESYSDEELNAMQANSPVMVRNSCKLMKQYNLNVFKKIGSTFDSCYKLNGYYEDGWLAKNSMFLIRTGDIGEINIEIYCPLNNFNDKEIAVYVDDIMVDTIEIHEVNQRFTVEVEANKIIRLGLEANFIQENTGQDIRELAVIILSMEGY